MMALTDEPIVHGRGIPVGFQKFLFTCSELEDEL